jgi:hypothetical protein
MAKQKITKSQNHQTDEKTRLTVHLGTEWTSALSALSTMRQTTLSDLFESILASHLSTLPRKELDLIRGMVSVATGKSLRLGKESGQSTAKTEEIEEGTTEREVADGAISRTNRITNIQSRFVNAVDEAVADFGK